MDGASERQLQFAAQSARAAHVHRSAVRAPCADESTRSVRHLEFGSPEAVSLAKPAKPAYEEQVTRFNGDRLVGGGRRRTPTAYYRPATRCYGRLSDRDSRCQHRRGRNHRAATPPATSCSCEHAINWNAAPASPRKMRHQVSLNGRQLFGVGGYWQQGSGEELRVRLELQSPTKRRACCKSPTAASCGPTSICPWRARSRDSIFARSATSSVATTKTSMNSGRAQRPGRRSSPIFRSAMADCRRCSPRLSEQFAFMPPQAMRWTPTPPLAGLPESLPVFAVVGHWKARDRSLQCCPMSKTPGRPARSPAAGSVDSLRPDRLVSLPHRISPTVQSARDAGRRPASRPFQLSRDPLVCWSSPKSRSTSPSPPASSTSPPATPSGTIARTSTSKN